MHSSRRTPRNPTWDTCRARREPEVPARARVALAVDERADLAAVAAAPSRGCRSSTALRPDHRLQHEHRRHRLAEDAQLDARRHPEPPGLEGVDPAARLGQPGRTFIGVLTTKNLLIAGEGGVHTNAAGRRVALLRAYDKLTGEDAGAVEMPNKQTGSPMSYQIDGKQFIVLAVSGNDGAELLACALP